MYLNGEDGLKQYRMFSRIKGSLKSFIYRECLVVYFFYFVFIFYMRKIQMLFLIRTYTYNDDSCIILGSQI